MIATFANPTSLRETKSKGRLSWKKKKKKQWEKQILFATLLSGNVLFLLNGTAPGFRHNLSELHWK